MGWATPPPDFKGRLKSVRLAGGWPRGPQGEALHLRAFNMVIPLLSQLPVNRLPRPISSPGVQERL